MSVTLDGLWAGPPTSTGAFDPDSVAGLPDSVARYLTHAIAPGTPLACSVRLSMHGTIKLNRWCPFTAEQVIRWERGMIWRAKVRMGLLPVRGFDRIVDGEGEMRWKLLGLIPLVRGSGADVTRSAIGRLLIESVWLPAVHAACGTWEVHEGGEATATLTAQGQAERVRLKLGASGALREVSMQRWGDPDRSGTFRLAPFGAVVEDEATFAGYTIPSRLRVGWYLGTAAFEAGEFFRATVDNAAFR